MKTENFKKPTGTLLYFAYGSNMNLNQMAFRCPDAEVVDTVRLEGYRLAFCMNGGRQNGIETAPVLEAVRLTQKELPKKEIPHKKHHRRKHGEER